MSKENLLHRQKLEEDGWLKNGTILQCWNADDAGYPRSHYVVAFQNEINAGVVIYCFRVFGGIGVIPVNISADQVADILPDGIKFQNNPNWQPAEGYER